MRTVLPYNRYDGDSMNDSFWVNPDDAVGNIIQFDRGGYSPKSLAEVVSVENDHIVVEVLFSREEHKLDCAQEPMIGKEFTHRVIQVRSDDGWEDAYTKNGWRQPKPYELNDYDPESDYRVIEKSYTHGVSEFHKYNIHTKDGEPMVHLEPRNLENRDVFFKMLDQIDEETLSDKRDVVGTVWLDAEKMKVVWYSIEFPHRVDNYITAVDSIERELYVGF